MMRRLLCASALLLSGCDELDFDGRLDNGEFQYECGGSGDAACHGVDAIAGFDLDRDLLPIAVGGSFGVTFDADIDEDEASDIIAVSPDLVSSDGAGFVFNEAAIVDFVARNVDGEVVDFRDLSSREPTGIAIFFDGGPTSSITLPVPTFEQPVIIAAAPVAGGDVLGGGFDWDWTVSPSGIVDLTENPVEEGGASNTARLDPGSISGTAFVSVSNGTFSAGITVVNNAGSSSTTTASGTGGAGGSGGASGGAGAGGDASGGAGGSAGAGGAASGGASAGGSGGG